MENTAKRDDEWFEDVVPNSTTLAAMEDAASGNDLIGPFDTLDELMDALNADVPSEPHGKT